MFKKSIAYIILFSMVLHCGCRLGFLDYLYEARHEIAHSIGLIAEVPMAMCNSDFDFGHETIIKAVDAEWSLPISAFANEINLFYISNYQLIIRVENISKGYHSRYKSDALADYIPAVFRPPTLC